MMKILPHNPGKNEIVGKTTKIFLLLIVEIFTCFKDFGALSTEVFFTIYISNFSIIHSCSFVFVS